MTNAYILAGGLSKRMGTDKGLMDWKGKKLVQYPIDIIRNLGLTPVIITNSEKYLNLGCECIPDFHKNKGPLGGLHAGLSHSKENHNLFFACDMPGVTIGMVTQLLKNLDPISNLCLYSKENNCSPFPGIYGKIILPIIENQLSTSNYKLKELINLTKHQLIKKENDFFGSELFCNFNTLNDLKK